VITAALTRRLKIYVIVFYFFVKETPNACVLCFVIHICLLYILDTCLTNWLLQHCTGYTPIILLICGGK